MTSILTFDGVTVRYPGSRAPALDGISFSLGPGERAALLGLNGSGKTTLLKAVVGLLPHAGTITVCGTPVTAGTLGAVREQVGFLFNVPEDQLLLPRVLDDVAFGLRRRGMSAVEAEGMAEMILGKLGIAELAQRQVYDLSHGQKLRVALAGVLALGPALALLDEPTAGLDPPGRRRLAELLERQGAALLVATHDLTFAEHLCTRFLLLDGATLVADSPDPAAIRERWGESSV